MANLDDLTGAIVRPLHALRTRPRNTIDRLSVYEGLSKEELFPEPGGLPRLEARKRRSLPGFANEDLRFASLHEPIEPAFREHYHRRRRRIQTVFARRIRPTGARGRPRLVYIHGYMQPETPLEELTLLSGMARALDVEVVHMQPPYHGRRRPRSSLYDGDRFWSADVVQSFEAIRQTVIDARTLLSLMLLESPTPVGIAGISLGGSFAAILTCVDARLAFSVPYIAHMDMGAILRDAPVLATMRADLGRFGWSAAEFGAFFERIGWGSLDALLPRERILMFAAEHDRFFDAELLRAMWRRWGEPEIHWYPTSHMGFIPILPTTFGRVRRFIDDVTQP